jgi:exopolysaccharide production protein ExoZ
MTKFNPLKGNITLSEKNRLHNLDYLRGMAATGIMLYHFLLWSAHSFNAGAFMGRIGVYGVSIFYVLSGLTLYYVYYDKLSFDKTGLMDFYIKRVFRIFPLLWLVIFLTIGLTKIHFDAGTLFLNLTGLFGIFQWDKYLGTGVWSIGNEVVFYLFFPLFVYLARERRDYFYVAAALILFVYLYFAFWKLNPFLPMAVQWSTYINPLNQVFLFLSGFCMGLFLHHKNVSRTLLGFIAVSALLLFILYPVKGDVIALVSGVNRLVFTVITLCICFFFYKLKMELPGLLHQFLKISGEISYSIYLLHPILWIFIGGISKYIIPMSTGFRLFITPFFTFGISYVVYNLFEQFFIRKGKLLLAANDSKDKTYGSGIPPHSEL